MNRFNLGGSLRKHVIPIVMFIIAFGASFLVIHKEGNNYKSIADFTEYRIEKKKNKKPSYGHPGRAEKWWYDQRASQLGYIPENWRHNALMEVAKNKLDKTSGMDWTELGPSNVGGRVRAVAVHPTNPDIIYAGSVSGGVWKSINGGGNWLKLKDDMENLAINALVLDPEDPNTVFAGTGEGYHNLDAKRGEGIFVSYDAGNTFTRLSSTFNSSFQYIYKLEFDPNTKALYAATSVGLFKSTNKGVSFTSVIASGRIVDLEITSSSTIWAASGTLNQSTLFKSTNGGLSFQSVLSKSGMGRIEIGTAKSDPDRIYVSMLKLSTYEVGYFGKSTDNGSTWVNLNIPGPSASGNPNYAGYQAWYDNIITVDPENADHVFIGGIDLWKSTDGGVNFIQKTNWYPMTPYQYVHADQHNIVHAPSNYNIMYFANDGGIYRSTNRGVTFASRNNGLSITQFYYGAVAAEGSIYAGGTQDNGTLKSTGTTIWSEILGGDGGATEIDHTNPNIIYMEYVDLALFKSVDGGRNFEKVMNGIPAGSDYWSGTTDRTQFISPFVLDPNDANNLVAGTYKLYRTTNKAASWEAISGDLTGDGTGSSGATISAIAIAPGNSAIIYAATTNGRIQVTTNTGTDWNLRNSGLPTGFITSIEIATNDPSTAYIAYSGFVSGNKVYKTTNYGSSWTNISGNIPNIPVNAVFVNPDDNQSLVIGTDLGIFTSADQNNWTKDVSFPNVSVVDLDYRKSDYKLFATTHGRGVFSAVVETKTVKTYDIAYDDGAPSGSYYWNLLGQGSATRITPPISNSKLISMSVYIAGTIAGTATYKPIILSSVTSAPGIHLADVPLKTSLTLNGWDLNDLSSYNIGINGDFFVGISYDGVNKPLFGYDAANNGRAWDFQAGAWTPWSETYFFRASVSSLTAVTEIDNQIPAEFSLTQNYPNPFNPETAFNYSLPQGRDVVIKIYNIQGQEVAELVNSFQAAGNYKVTWNGKNNRGEQVASGVYIYSVKAGSFTQTKKMMLMK